MVCVILFSIWGIVVMGICLLRFCLDMNVGWDFIYSELVQGTTSCSEKCYFGVIYVWWCSVCNFVMISAVEVFVHYGGV